MLKRASCFSPIAAAVMHLAAPVAQAQARAHFDLPSQSLSVSLRALGSQTSTNVLFDPPLVEGRDAPALQAELTLDEAFKRLLIGTGLKHRFLDGKTVMVISATQTIEKTTAEAAEQSDMRLAQNDLSKNSHGSDTSSAEAAENKLEEIVVTANKRTESINDVPMSITALSGAALTKAGIVGVSDLARVTPGFTFTKTHNSVPVLSIRGIGYYDDYLGATPAVSAYSDEAPLPYPIMTSGVFLDLERVEVLKGPQGTLFGQNSTGGALNFVAAKPRDTFQAETSLGYGNFGRLEANGYVTGPVGEALRARLSAKYESGEEWQRSYTRTDELGEVDRGGARLLLDWEAAPTLTVSLALEGWYDKSELQAAQLTGLNIAIPIPEYLQPALATGDPFGVDGPPTPLTQVYPNAPRNARAAGWSSGIDRHSDNEYYRASLRADYELSDALTLTSITAYQSLDYNARTDVDGTELQIADYFSIADIGALYQEMRVGGKSGPVTWLLGGNYAENSVDWAGLANFRDWSVPVGNLIVYTDQQARTYAVFGNLEYELAGGFALQAGARYTNDRQNMQGCPADSGDGVAADAYNHFRGTHDLVPGGCVSLDDLGNPPTFEAGRADLTLEEDNVSWRVGLTYEPRSDVLLYANISKGYKAGAFTLSTFDYFSQALPATQESVLAYETGFKLGGGSFQINGAAFYYDYKDKQLLAPFLFETFGLLDKLQNVPKSRVAGAELQTTWNPLSGLQLGLNGTFVDSKVTSDFFAANPIPGSENALINLHGLSFPYTPRWQGSADATYSFPLAANLSGSIGASVSYRSETNGRFGGRDLYRIESYALLDLRAGIETSDSKYALDIWGRNVTNRCYQTNVTSNADTVIAFAGMPRTYGIRGTVRF